MADLGEAELAAKGGDDDVRGHPGGLVHGEDAVGVGEDVAHGAVEHAVAFGDADVEAEAEVGGEAEGEVAVDEGLDRLGVFGEAPEVLGVLGGVADGDPDVGGAEVGGAFHLGDGDAGDVDLRVGLEDAVEVVGDLAQEEGVDAVEAVDGHGGPQRVLGSSSIS